MGKSGCGRTRYSRKEEGKSFSREGRGLAITEFVQVPVPRGLDPPQQYSIPSFYSMICSGTYRLVVLGLVNADTKVPLFLFFVLPGRVSMSLVATTSLRWFVTHQGKAGIPRFSRYFDLPCFSKVPYLHIRVRKNKCPFMIEFVRYLPIRTYNASSTFQLPQLGTEYAHGDF